MSDNFHEPQDTLEDLQNGANDKTQGNNFYANSIRFNLTPYEVVFDFYILSPSPTELPGTVQAERISRVTVPLSVVEKISAVLPEAIENWKKALEDTSEDIEEASHD